MTRFRFPLARLLSLRERRERDAAIALAAARSAEASVRLAYEAARARHQEARAHVTPGAGSSRTIADLQRAAFIVEQLDVRASTASGELAAASREATSRQASLVERVRDRRVLERLRDRQQSDWRIAADRKAREEMDEIAQSRARTAEAYQSQRNKA
ncbi:MAG TPA: flagellar export protein FliJ [Gemmatimonadaceae bacterium]|nr:flagellar export protein FliJ [Gemmatimonadaceae bacterium]